MGWLSGYLCRKAITLTGGSDGAQTDFQLKLSIAYDSDMLSDFSDLRFTDADGETLIDAWLEDKTDGTSADVWVEFPTTPANGVEQTYYMYYGKADALSDWDIAATFLFGDDFPGTSLDTAKWDSSGTIEVGSSEVTLNEDDTIVSKTKFGFGYAVHVKSKADEQDILFVGLRADTGNSNRHDLDNSDGNYPDDFDKFLLVSDKDGTYDNHYEDNWNDFRNTYYIYRIKRISTTEVIFEQESHSWTETDSSYIPTVDLGAYLGVWDSSQASTLIADWIFVRKYAANPPTYGFGSEENAPTGLTILDFERAAMRGAFRGIMRGVV